MELLLAWLGTIGVSLVLDTSFSLRLLKDLADQGYKVEFKKYKEVSNDLKKSTKGSMNYFVPIINILSQFQRLMDYNNYKPIIFDQLKVLGCIEPLTTEEELEYQKKPTGWNALITPLKREIAKSDAVTITYIDDNQETNSICYETYQDSKNNQEGIRIIKVEGPVSKLPLEKQQKIAVEYTLKVYREINNNFTKKEFKTKVKQAKKDGSNVVIDLNKGEPKQVINAIDIESITDPEKLKEMRELLAPSDDVNVNDAEKTYKYDFKDNK